MKINIHRILATGEGSPAKPFRFIHSRLKGQKGFTLIELMIVVGVIAILLSLAIPTYSSYSIRTKIAEGLAVANAAKTATSTSCQEDMTLTDLDNAKAGYLFAESGADTDHVKDIIISGDCPQPVITIITKNTGAPDPQPVIALTGDFPPSTVGQLQWACASSNTPNHLLPDTCRS